MPLSSIRGAFRIVFSGNGYKAIAGLFAALSFLFYISIPIILVPGGIARFLSMTPVSQLIPTAALSLVMGIVFAMQVFSYRHRILVAKHAGAGLAGFFSGSLSAMVATASCASCLSVVFSFMGFAAIAFLMAHRLEITVIAFAIVLASLYFTSKKIVGGCPSCSDPGLMEKGKGGEDDEAGE